MPDQHKRQKAQEHCADEQGPHQYSPVELLGAQLTVYLRLFVRQAYGALLARVRREHGLAVRAANGQ